MYKTRQPVFSVGARQKKSAVKSIDLVYCTTHNTQQQSRDVCTNHIFSSTYRDLDDHVPLYNLRHRHYTFPLMNGRSKKKMKILKATTCIIIRSYDMHHRYRRCRRRGFCLPAPAPFPSFFFFFFTPRHPERDGGVTHCSHPSRALRLRPL